MIVAKVENGFINTEKMGALTRLPDSDFGEYDDADEAAVKLDFHGV